MPNPRALARQGLERLLARRGLRIATREDAADPFRLADFTPELTALYERVRPYTMTSPEKVAVLVQAVEHVVATGVPGAFVECGVFRGGSSMAAALTFARLGDTRELYLFDTFAGMPEPGPDDVDFRGVPASRWWDPDHQRRAFVEQAATEPDVAARMAETSYPAARVHLVKGMVEDTVPARAPAQISILRLDTDFHASTHHELEHLWPRLAPGGVLLVDDYGHFAGARRAVDEYFAAAGERPFLHRIDYSGRLVIKPARRFGRI